MSGFCASIVLAFILGVELFDYVVDGVNLREPGWGKKAKWGIWSQNGGGGGSNPQDVMCVFSCVYVCVCVRMEVSWTVLSCLFYL